MISCENHSEAERILEWLKSLEGAETVRMGVMRDFIVVDSWLDGEIEKRALGDA